MSLDVSPQLLADAEKGEVREEEFVRTVRTSLPYAYALIASLVGELRAGKAEFTDNQTPPLPAGARVRCDVGPLHLAAVADPEPVCGVPRLLTPRPCPARPPAPPPPTAPSAPCPRRGRLFRHAGAWGAYRGALPAYDCTGDGREGAFACAGRGWACGRLRPDRARSGPVS